MAKRGRKPRVQIQYEVERNLPARQPSESAVATAAGEFASDLGKFLGDTERKASEWLGQRKAMSDRLTAIRDKAASLLHQIGSMAPPMPSLPGRRRRGRPPGSKNQPAQRNSGTPRKAKRRTMSAEARERIAAAQRKRWAKVKRERERE
ncbi:MAG: hypothetical protein LC775_11180 [Acidobacteria bacterium]|nr:hypothetical protein [Acidobacteriota bacterium]